MDLKRIVSISCSSSDGQGQPQPQPQPCAVEPQHQHRPTNLNQELIDLKRQLFDECALIQPDFYPDADKIMDPNLDNYLKMFMTESEEISDPDLDKCLMEFMTESGNYRQ